MKKAGVFAVLILFCLTVTAGCSSGASAPPGRTNAVSPSSGAEYAAADAAGLANGAQKASAKSAAENRTVSDSRKVIKSAELELQTIHYDEANQKLEALATSFGGYIESSTVQGNVSGSDTLRSASYTMRVPSDRLEEFLTGAGNLGSVVRKSIRGEDVTQNYFDSETRLKTLRAEQDRILELMRKAEKIDDVLSIEKRLTEVQDEIEQLTGQLKQWDSLISLSTVTVTVKEVVAITVPPAKGLGGQLGSIFRASLHALGEVCRYFVLAVAAALPFLAVAAVIGAAVLLFRRKIKKGRGTSSVGPGKEDSGKPDAKQPHPPI